MEKTNLSLLEEKAEGEQTHKVYKEEFSNTLSFARPLGLDVEKAESLDRMAVDCMTEPALRPRLPSVQGRPACGRDHYPVFGRMGSLKLPRMWRALKGYRKLCPGKSIGLPAPNLGCSSQLDETDGHQQRSKTGELPSSGVGAKQFSAR